MFIGLLCVIVFIIEKSFIALSTKRDDKKTDKNINMIRKRTLKREIVNWSNQHRELSNETTFSNNAVVWKLFRLGSRLCNYFYNNCICLYVKALATHLNFSLFTARYTLIVSLNLSTVTNDVRFNTYCKSTRRRLRINSRVIYCKHITLNYINLWSIPAKNLYINGKIREG